MADELAWRKFPRNAARDENLDYIAYLLGDKAPQALLFFTIMYCICDDDGVFDLEDGIIFSRMMKTGTPDDVLHVASLMEQRRVITRVIDNVFMIRAWDAPQRANNFGRTAKTMEERRAAVAEKIRKEREREPSLVNINFEQARANAAEAAAFFYPENDKIQKNVATQRERERETDYTERLDETERTQREENLETERKETHTEGFAPAQHQGAYATPQEKSVPRQQEDLRGTEQQEGKSIAEQLAGMAAEVYEVKQPYGQEKRRQLLCQLNDFFAKNCYGYEGKQHTGSISELADRIFTLASEKNRPEIIAGIMTSQFLTLSKSEGYYKDMPLTPEMLLKPGPYTHVLERTGQILLTKDQDTRPWTAERDKYMAQLEKNHAAVDNWIEEECLKYGIDPHDPQRQVELMRAKAAHGN